MVTDQPIPVLAIASRALLDRSVNPLGVRSSGGVASALAAALPDGACVIGAAQSAGDRAVAGRLLAMNVYGRTLRVKVVDTPPFALGAQMLWRTVVHEVDYSVRFGAPEYIEAFVSFTQANERLVEGVLDLTEHPSPYVFWNDIQCVMAPRHVRRRRPGARLWGFIHTPWPDPETFRVIPERIRREIIGSMLESDLVGFHWDRWAGQFLRCCGELGWEVDLQRRIVHGQHGDTHVGIYPLPPDLQDYRHRARSAEVQALIRQLAVPERLNVVSVGRTDPTKAGLERYQIYRRVLDKRPDLVSKLVIQEHWIPSRQNLTEYREYRVALECAGEAFNAEYPQRLLVQRFLNDRNVAVAEYSFFDVLLVTSRVDGMNLVAQEGAALNSGGVIILSANVGAAGVLRGSGAIIVDPFDDDEIAKAIILASDMSAQERAETGRALRLAMSRTPQTWYKDQVALLDAIVGERA